MSFVHLEVPALASTSIMSHRSLGVPVLFGITLESVPDDLVKRVAPSVFGSSFTVLTQAEAAARLAAIIAQFADDLDPPIAEARRRVKTVRKAEKDVRAWLAGPISTAAYEMAAREHAYAARDAADAAAVPQTVERKARALAPFAKGAVGLMTTPVVITAAERLRAGIAALEAAQRELQKLASEFDGLARELQAKRIEAATNADSLTTALPMFPHGELAEAQRLLDELSALLGKMSAAAHGHV